MQIVRSARQLRLSIARQWGWGAEPLDLARNRFQYLTLHNALGRANGGLSVPLYERRPDPGLPTVHGFEG